MSRLLAWSAAAAALWIWPLAARADIPPPPDFVRRMLATEIARAGHDCPSVTSNSIATSPESDALVWGARRPELAVCSNGKRFLVALPPSRSGPPVLNRTTPPEPEPKPPAVRVKPM